MIYSWYDSSQTQTFAFTFAVGTPVKFCFDKVLVPAAEAAGNRPFKRRRPLWDVDGGTSEGKKKRRLRLNLITSRLSRPFSIPATNIVDRGISKIAVWAKGKRLDKSLLRKAAIMNRVRTRLDAAKATARRASEEYETRQAVDLRQFVVQKPRYINMPLPPSPLGLSNYDALDLEDEMFEDEDGDVEGGHDHDPSIFYSDWKVVKSCDVVDGDDYKYLDELDGIPPELAEERPPPPPDERMVEMMKEKERQKELCFVNLHFSA